MSTFSSFWSWPGGASKSSSGGWITTVGISSLAGETSSSGTCSWLCRALVEVGRPMLGLEGGLFWGVGTGVVQREPAGVPALEEGRRWLRRRDKGDSPLNERFEADRPVRKEWREAERPSPEIKQINEKRWSSLQKAKRNTQEKSLYAVNCKLSSPNISHSCCQG